MKDLLLLSAYTSKINATGYLVPIGLGFGIIVGFIFGSNMMAYIFVCLLLLDFITGIIASIKRGEKITSIRVRDMWFKWIAYLSVLLISALLTHVTIQPWIHAAALGWVVLSEGVSILENCEYVIGKSLPFLNRLKNMLNIMRNGK